VRPVVCMGEIRNSFKVLVGKPERQKPLERLGHKWENNNRLDLTEIGLDGLGWFHLIGSCEHGKEPSGSMKGGKFLDQLSDY